MPDAIENLINSPMGEARTQAADTPAFEENCARCGGSGQYRHFGRCFACSGTGRQTFRTSAKARAAGRRNTARRATVVSADVAESAAGFKAANPDVMAWIAANPTFEFAVNMGEAIERYGDLTEKQLIACLKCVRASTGAAEARQSREANAPEISIARIEEAFVAAREANLRWPKLNLATFVFKPAGANSRWVGSIYVTEDGTYLGRVTTGRFVAVAACSPDQQEKIIEAAADPEAAAIAYGRHTGSCACCGRELTAGESLDRGIGPICAENYGW